MIIYGKDNIVYYKTILQSSLENPNSTLFDANLTPIEPIFLVCLSANPTGENSLWNTKYT